MTMNVGINLIETDGTATPSIQGAVTSVAAFVIRAQRGSSTRVVEVTSFAEFARSFGGHLGDAFGAYAIKGFFDNGGTRAHVTRLIGTGGAAANASIGGGTGSLTVTAGSFGEAEVGTWGNALSIVVRANPAVAGTFDLLVQQGGVTVETWERLKGTADAKPNERPDKLNDPLAGSRYVRVTSTLTANPAAGTTPLENGADDTLSGAALTAAITAALARFDARDIQLLACPETDDEAVILAATAYCASRGDCTFVGHTPRGSDVAAVKTYVASKNLRGDKVYGALYFPYILVVGPSGTKQLVPPEGHVMGVYARTDRERGIWKAPAGNAARVLGALDLEFQVNDVQHTDLVKTAGVCAIRAIPGYGVVIDSSRTLSTNPLWLYVNVRLLFNFVKTSLKLGLRWVVQEPNDPTLWNKVKYSSVIPFLMGLWRRGAFGPGKPEEVFTVKVDAENNPPANIQQGLLTVDVFFYPSRPAETIVITVGQQSGGASTSES